MNRPKTVKLLTPEQRTKLLKDLCLHCVFMEAHADKWPDWNPVTDERMNPAFDDMVGSAIRIVANIFTMLEPKDQIRFIRDAVQMSRNVEQAAGMTKH